MAVTHEWLGVGRFPDGPIVEYMARSLSAFYAAYGGALWVIAGDLRRYAGVLTYMAVVAIVLGVAIPVVDIAIGMPLYWTLQEGAYALAFGAAILLLQRRVGR